MTSETKAPKTAKKPSRKSANKEQFERFVKTAREIGGGDEDPEALNRAFGKVVPPKRPST